MLKFGKRPLPMVGKISELLVSGSSAGFSDTGTSPRGPLDLKIQPTSSPRGVKSYDVGGVGLGIVAALEKSTHNGREILAKYAVFCPNTNRSDPIPVNSGQNCDGFSSGGVQEFEEDRSENYTYVTLRGRKKSCTKVYYDGGDCAGSAMHRRASSGGLTICADDLESSVFPTSDFLSCCHLCKKNLHGKDIYMYRGEKAFCSTECRSTQIVADERKEQCRLEASRSADVSSSSCSKDEIFFSTGILVI